MDELLKVFQNMDFSNEEVDMSYNSRVLIIDGMNTFIRSYSAVPSMDDNGNHIGGTVGFLKSLGMAVRTFNPTRVIIVFDGKGGSQRRRKLYPEYKQNRKPPIRLNRAYDLTTDEQEQENLKWQLITLIELLECLPVTILAIDNVEADDVIAHLTSIVSENNGSVIIYSSDKDFFQLASDKVKVYNPIKKKTFNDQVILEDFGIHPKHFHFYRALDGDKSDNINGVKGVGMKSLIKYLPEVADPSVDINIDFIREKYKDQKKVPKMIQNILDNPDIVERNLQLMDLHEGIMSSHARIHTANVFNNTAPSFDKYALTKLLIKYNLINAIHNFDTWVSQNFIRLNRFRNE